jgi:two-component sensor histidine kinase
MKVANGLVDHRYIAKVFIINDFDEILAEAVSENVGPGNKYLNGVKISGQNIILIPLIEKATKLNVGKLIIHLNGSLITRNLLQSLAFDAGYILFWDLILLAILTAVIYSWLVKPLTDIIKKLVALEIRYPLEERITVPKHHKNDEMGKLAETINNMLSELSSYMELQEQNEEEIRMSLMEKEILLKEIHHRVKNNLQIISSLLNLQRNTIHDHEAQKIIIESQNRISAMSLVHEELYSSENLSEVNFKTYIEKLSLKLKEIYSGRTHITYKTEIPDIYLNINTTINCGLIVNELLSNAFKYAFQNQQQGIISINLAIQDTKAALTISDNGIGLPEQLQRAIQSNLGLQLVNGLVEQLDGTLEIQNKRGTRFIITFPLGIT